MAGVRLGSLTPGAPAPSPASHTLGAAASPPAAGGAGQEYGPAVRPAPFDAARRRNRQGHRPSAGGQSPWASPRRARRPAPRLRRGDGGVVAASAERTEGKGGQRTLALVWRRGCRRSLRSAAFRCGVGFGDSAGSHLPQPAGPPSLRSLPRLTAAAPRDGPQRSASLPHTGCAGVPAGCRRSRPEVRAGRQAGAFRREAPPPRKSPSSGSTGRRRPKGRRPSAAGRFLGASPQAGRKARTPVPSVQSVPSTVSYRRAAAVGAAAAGENRSAGFPRSGGKRLAVFHGTGSFRRPRRGDRPRR